MISTNVPANAAPRTQTLKTRVAAFYREAFRLWIGHYERLIDTRGLPLDR